MSFNSKEQAPAKVGLTVNESIRKSLMGFPSHPKRAEQMLLAQSAAEKFDFKILETLGLKVDQEQLKTISPEHLQEFSRLLETSPQEEIISSFQEAVQQYSNPETQRSFTFPTEKVGLRLATLFLILLMAGALLMPDRAFGAAALPTVTPNPGEVLPTITPTSESDDEEATPTVTPKPTKKATTLATATPTLTPYPTVTNTPTPTPEITPTPEVLVDWAVISVPTANLRSEPSLNGDVLTQGTEGQLFQFAPENQQPTNQEWAAVLLPDGRIAYLHQSVFTKEQHPAPSTGTGGNVEEAAVEPSVSASPATTEQSPENVQESTAAQAEMDKELPLNFKEYYREQGGEVSFDSELGLYKVTFGEKEFVILPKSGVNELDDLEKGLFTLGENATITSPDGTQRVTLLVNREYPFTGQDIPLQESVGSTLNINPFWTSEEQVPGKNITYKELTFNVFKDLFKLEEGKPYNLVIAIGGVHADAALGREVGVRLPSRITTNQIESVVGRVIQVGDATEIITLFPSKNFKEKYLVDLDSTYRSHIPSNTVIGEAPFFHLIAQEGASIAQVNARYFDHLDTAELQYKEIQRAQKAAGQGIESFMWFDVPQETRQEAIDYLKSE